MDIAKFKNGDIVLITTVRRYKYIGEIESIICEFITFSDGSVLYKRPTEPNWNITKLPIRFSYLDIDTFETLLMQGEYYEEYFSRKWI